MVFNEAPASSITERAPILPTVNYAVLALMNLNIAFVASEQTMTCHIRHAIIKQYFLRVACTIVRLTLVSYQTDIKFISANASVTANRTSTYGV